MTGPPTASSGAVRRRARRGLAIYFAVVAVLSVALEAVVVSRPDIDGPFIAALMCVPALASVIARLALGEGFADVSFRFGGRRTGIAVVLALLFPTVVGLVAYGTAWASGLTWFEPAAGDGATPIVQFAVGLVLATTFWTLLSSILAAGEEIGWRGYMLTRLIDAGVPRPVLASGLIWGLWHVPIVLWGSYAAGPWPALSAAIIMVSIVSFGYVIARLRLETGSIWPAIVLHGCWNSVIQGPFDGSTAGAGAALWTGESGVLTALVLVVGAVVFSRGRWTIVRNLPRKSAEVTERRGAPGCPAATRTEAGRARRDPKGRARDGTGTRRPGGGLTRGRDLRGGGRHRPQCATLTQRRTAGSLDGELPNRRPGVFPTAGVAFLCVLTLFSPLVVSGTNSYFALAPRTPHHSWSVHPARQVSSEKNPPVGNWNNDMVSIPIRSKCRGFGCGRRVGGTVVNSWLL